MREIPQETELVRRAASGDSEAFIVLCETHRARLWRVVASVSEGTEREDLAQEAIVRAFSALKSYRGEASFAAWLCRIALNAAHDYQKSAWRRRVLPLSDISRAENDPTESLQNLAERRELQRCVRQAVALLPSAQRVPIWLYYFEEFTIAEVARLEKCSESTIRSRVQAGLKRLSLSLNDLISVPDSHLSPGASPKGCEI